MSNNYGKMRTKRWGSSLNLKMMRLCFNSSSNTKQDHHHHHQQSQAVPYCNHQQQNDDDHHQAAAAADQNHSVITCTTTTAPKDTDSHHSNKPAPTMIVTSPTNTTLPAPPKDVKELRQNPWYSNSEVFTFDEMKRATQHFKPELILGEGGFGTVYKGVLNDKVRQGGAFKTSVEVAIKQLNPNGYQGDREWLAEVNYLGHLSHPNLVKLIGYCCEGEQRLLVYEYLAFGCLEKHLFRRMSTTMTWLRRIKVALDAAKGLAFLHGLERSIIYRDFKTSNILLDKNFNAKLSDFGLAKEGPMGDQTHVSTRVMGTYGYAAPEYIMTGHLTALSDVYGYGVVLLEMLIGRRTLDKGRTNQEHSLVDWCRPILNNSKKLPKILDTRLDGQYTLQGMMTVATLAHKCLSNSPKGRPLMSQVVEILEEVYAAETSYADSMVMTTTTSGHHRKVRKGGGHRKEKIGKEEQTAQPGGMTKSSSENSLREGDVIVNRSLGRCRSETEDEFDAAVIAASQVSSPNNRSAISEEE